MTKYTPDTKAERLLQLSEEIGRIAGSLAQLSIASADPVREWGPVAGSGAPDVSEETVNWLIRARRERARYLPPELFADPAWDILLDLLQAEITSRPATVSSVCSASGVPATTALRWLKHLADEGLVLRKPDPNDGRRVYVELAPKVSEALRCYVVDVVQAEAGGAGR
jgi:DNA-binding MarR family transcriptional regulator